MANDTKPKVSGVETKASTSQGVEESKTPVAGESIVVPATQQIVEKHKRKYTRKPKDNVETSAPSPVVQVNLELLKKSVQAIGGSIDGFLVRGLYRKAKKVYAFIDPTTAEEEAKGLAAPAGITQGELEVVSESTSVIFSQNEFLMRHAPWVMLAGVGVSYGARMVMAYGKLDAMEKKIEALQKGGAVTAPKPIINESNPDKR